MRPGVGAPMFLACLVLACVLSACGFRPDLEFNPRERSRSHVVTDCINRVGALSAGSYHSVVAKLDGTVWGWGLNAAGAVGDGTTTDRNTPVQVKGPGGVGTLNSIVTVAAGGDHSLAVAGDGTVWAWGHNGGGALGDGTVINRSTPVQVGGPGGVGVLSGAVTVAGTGSHSLALKSDGTVWAWGFAWIGNNYYSTTPMQMKGPGGVGAFSNVAALGKGGPERSLVVQSPFGTLWTWGDNSYGQLGDGTTISTTTPVQIKGFGSSVYCPPD